jgi:hypothetical protein
MELPSLVYDFSHARIDAVAIGPRREATLTLAVLAWDGPNGRMVEGVRVRFGGIENFAEVSAFFASEPQEQSELAWLRYTAQRRSKPGGLFFELVFERIDAQLVVQCSSLQVSGPTSESGPA